MNYTILENNKVRAIYSMVEDSGVRVKQIMGPKNWLQHYHYNAIITNWTVETIIKHWVEQDNLVIRPTEIQDKLELL